MRRLPLSTRVLPLAAALALALPGAALAQSAYRYRDASGQWVFTDRPTGKTAPIGNAFSLRHEPGSLHIAVNRVDTSSATRLVAESDCLCAVTLRVAIEQSDFPDIPAGAAYDVTLDPGARQTLVEAPHQDSARSGLRFNWSTALGSPTAVHRPPRPYRAPFAVGTTYMVSQAFPAHVTHDAPDSAYAVDFALPDGTPIYAAREGTVINVRHDSFSGAPLPAMVDQANLVEILHDDGTIAVYAHLHWDSIRVHIGQHVGVGEYIANSGNTGFTTGPHLHFAVWRNAGGADVSVPVEFAELGGAALTARTATPLTAY
jgi:murein DD-endopeptidase MepM/ murein hydrolase activator NlpD